MGRFSMVFGISLSGVLFSAPARATELSMDCPQLSPEDVDELDARLNLLLQARVEPSPRRVEVHCSDDVVHVDVVGKQTLREQADASDWLVDGVLDAVERALVRRANLEAESGGDSPEVDPSSDLERLSTEPSRGPAEATTGPTDAGGLGLGVTSEYAFAPLGTLLGPRLDLAVGRGPYAVSLAETLRFSSARGRGVIDFDAMAGFGFGAPFAANYDFGVHLGFGVEWLSVGIERRRSTDSVPAGQLSVRMAWPLGSFALWAALDVRVRFGTLSLDDPINAELARVTPLLTLGGVILADPGGD